MKNKEIEDRIKALHGIDELNGLQKSALRSDALHLVIIAPTGSGKTLAFGARMLKYLPEPGNGIAVVIAPSRELVMQISSVLRQLARGYKTVAFYGGHNMADEVNSLSPLPDIIVATPGRLLDHLQRGTCQVDSLSMIVLDEYDKSLQLGFEGEMKRIVKRLPQKRRVTLTSATMLPVLPEYLNISDAEIIDETISNESASRIETIHMESFSRDKLDTLSGLLATFGPEARTIVFVNHRESAERIATRLRKDGFVPALYHGALDQQQRQMAIDLFTNGSAPVMVATDLAARGLDISGVENVVHYHLPVDSQTWTHRNGRTARQNAEGRVYVITSEADSLPEFIEWDRDYQPAGLQGRPSQPPVATLYFSAGKKEKISKGDVLGFIIANSGLQASEIGRIIIHDHYSLAAVPRSEAKTIIASLNEARLKGKKVKASLVKP